MLDVCGVTDLRLEGVSRFAETRPAVVVANHESLFDPAVLMKASELPMRFIVKGEVRRFPIFGRALSAMGHVFIDRGNGDRANVALQSAADAIRSGRTIMAFPEGTRTVDGKVKEFKKGVLFMAIEAQAPIAPVAINDTRLVMRKGSKACVPGDVWVEVLEPISTASYTRDTIEELVTRVRNEIAPKVRYDS